MSFRQDYGPREKPLRKWDQIGELVRRATQTHYPSERAALTMEIVALLNSEERKMIGIQDEDVEKWGDDMTRKYATLRCNEEDMRDIARYRQAGYQQRFLDKHGNETSYYHYLETDSRTRFSIDWNICRILRQIYEICESKGVRLGVGVEIPGPKGTQFGVSRIMAREVEVTRETSSSDEGAQTAGSEESAEAESS